MLVMEVRGYMVWLYGKGDAVYGVGAMVKDELCEEVVRVRRVSDRVMTVVFFRRMC